MSTLEIGRGPGGPLRPIAGGVPVRSSAPSPFNYGLLSRDLAVAFNPLSSERMVDYQVVSVRDGFVELSVAMPEGMLQGFTSVVTGFAEFFRFMSRRAQIQAVQKKPIDPDEVDRRNRAQDKFRKQVCGLFDGFIGKGMSRNEAIRETNRVLREKNNPWATYELVRSTLSGCGRFRIKQSASQSAGKGG